MWLILLILAISTLILLIRHQYTHWEHKGIPHEKPSIPFGSLDAVRKKEKPFGLAIYDIYNRSKEQLVGIYLFFRPAILVRDAELARKILTSDFGSFHDRGVYVDEDNDPLSSHLFAMEGKSWKTLRTKLAPSFSSGKLKGMFGTIDDVGDTMVEHLNGVLEGKGSQLIEMKNIMGTYAVDIIGSVIFGLDINSFQNPNNKFRKISESTLKRQKILETIFSLCSFMCPLICKILVRFGYEDATLTEVRDIVNHTIEHREKHKVVRKDLLQLLIQLRNAGNISQEDDHNWNIETVADHLKAMSIDSIASNSFLFYIAGSETTSATSSFTLYELAMNPALLQRVQKELEETYVKHGLKPGDKLTYDLIQDLKFLDLCVMETTRKYPGLPMLNRVCTHDYQVPGTNYTITKGTPIIISVFGLHRDPAHFPDPLKYDPDRFSTEESNYNPTAFMPFGEGPRHCIAQRMGVVNTKVALVKILTNFDLEPLEHKEVEFEFNPAPVLLPKGGLHLKIAKKLK